MLAAIDVKDGDTVYVTCSDDNVLKNQAHDRMVFEALATAEEVMDENCILLHALGLGFGKKIQQLVRTWLKGNSIMPTPYAH